MTSAGKMVTLDELQAYIDGELEPLRRDEVEAHLAEHPEDAARVEAYRRQDQALRRALSGVAKEPIPERLFEALSDQPPKARQSASPWLRQVAAALLFIAIGGGVGWGFGKLPGSAAMQQEAFLRAAVIAHDTFAVEPRHHIEVSAAEKEHLQAWLSKRLGTSIAAPDLSEAGLTLLGGRLLPTDAGPAALLMYETAAGERITCYITADAGRLKPGKAYREAGGTGAMAWPTGKLSYAIAGPTDPERLSQMAGVVNRKLTESGHW